MEIKITKITNKSLADLACSYTAGRSVDVQNMRKLYASEHSPVRTQIFTVEMQNIPTFVSVHLVRHNIGVEHFVKSNRSDRGGDETAGRLTPVNHLMVLNAQALINIARKRLCYKASEETRLIMQLIRARVYEVDADLAVNMQPDCVYRGQCNEFKPCGMALYLENETAQISRNIFESTIDNIIKRDSPELYKMMRIRGRR